ncbi:MAG TPA: hypothetical protein VND01_00655 [Candidatus Acidoferrales bacterium]|nr:hypothetical protein [Candidatus Acidoferrales bacterium]
MTPEEFAKRLNICTTKFNLFFAYQSASQIDFDKLDVKSFAVARYYADLCYLDMQRTLLMIYNEQDSKYFESLEQKLNDLDTFLTMVLKKIDSLPK